jgi:hypothetical protein
MRLLSKPIHLGPGAKTITLTGGQLTIQDTLIINATGNLTLDGNKRSRIFEINGNVSATVSKLKLVNGSANKPRILHKIGFKPVSI